MISIIERKYQKPKTILKINISTDHPQWEQILNFAVMAHYTTYHISFKCAPTEISYGRTPHSALDLIFPTLIRRSNQPTENCNLQNPRPGNWIFSACDPKRPQKLSKHMAQGPSTDGRLNISDLRIGTSDQQQLVFMAQLGPVQDLAPTVAYDEPFIFSHSPPTTNAIHSINIRSDPQFAARTVTSPKWTLLKGEETLHNPRKGAQRLSPSATRVRPLLGTTSLKLSRVAGSRFRNVPIPKGRPCLEIYRRTTLTASNSSNAALSSPQEFTTVTNWARNDSSRSRKIHPFTRSQTFHWLFWNSYGKSSEKGQNLPPPMKPGQPKVA